MAKSVKDYEDEIKLLELAKEKLQKVHIPQFQKAIEDNKNDRDKKDNEIFNLKVEFNLKHKDARRQRNAAEKMRRKFSRDLKDAKKELQGIPQKQSYCQAKIRSLKSAESSKPVEKDPKRKAKDGEGIESLGGII